MQRVASFIIVGMIILTFSGCKYNSNKEILTSTRQMADTIGFAHLDWQVDSVMNRINRLQSKELAKATENIENPWRVAICPHDDYTYVGWHYPALLGNIKAKTVIIFGVAHKARQLNVSDQIVFDSYSHWHGPYSNIKVSSLREEIIKGLPEGTYQVNDSLQKVEHSVESMLPFLQYFNRDVEIISILVPALTFDKMNEIAKPLSAAILESMKKHNLEWGKDVALLITTDAVHYGDDDWGGKNMAPYGVDSAGYKKAVNHENAIVDSCFRNELSVEKVKWFVDFTVQKENYKEYKWTWCGRYSVPLGLLTALNMQEQTQTEPLQGQLIGYTNSIDHKPIPVEDLRMGKTAIATIRHWVGYASVGYK
ncbi:MAG: AmmeMemoRadiSam system protein B [Tenuifilaceae bacterium]